MSRNTCYHVSFYLDDHYILSKVFRDSGDLLVQIEQFCLYLGSVYFAPINRISYSFCEVF